MCYARMFLFCYVQLKKDRGYKIETKKRTSNDMARVTDEIDALIG